MITPPHLTYRIEVKIPYGRKHPANLVHLYFSELSEGAPENLAKIALENSQQQARVLRDQPGGFPSDWYKSLRPSEATATVYRHTFVGWRGKAQVFQLEEVYQLCAKTQVSR